MRSPGVVYRRYRQIRKKIFYDTVKKASECSHNNCFYGKTVTYTDENNVERSIKICGYANNLNEGTVEVCTCPQACNAFINKWTKEEIISITEKALADHEYKKKVYPCLNTLEWVLDKDLYEATKDPGFFRSAIICCIDFLENLLKK